MEGGIATLQEKYEACVAKKNELEYQYQLCEKRLVRADKVHFLFRPNGDSLHLRKAPPDIYIQ